MKPLSIAHIINPFIANQESDLSTAQPITFETMKIAKEKAKDELIIEQYAACYPQDGEMVPDFLKLTKPLRQSVMDVGKFEGYRKFPLIREILDRIYQTSSADYFVFSNVDIALMPDFYRQVAKIIRGGYDGFVINRHTISGNFSSIEEIPQMIKEAKKGEQHPGYDCFIFRRCDYQKYKLGTACVGANWIGRVIISNIMANCQSFKIFENLHLTFHIGDDRVWNFEKHHEFNRHNEKELLKILTFFLDRKETKHMNLLKDIQKYHISSDSINPDKLLNIITINTPTYTLPREANELYHFEYRHSTSWENETKQLLRQDPIFIVGYPRSGTTLLQALIATQENHISLPETHFFSIVRLAITVENDKIIPHCLEKVIQRIRQRVAFSKNAEKFVYNLASGSGVSVKMLFEIIIIDNLIQRAYLDKINQLRWVEKTPDQVYFLDIMLRFYPSAKIIYVMRNPEKSIISRRKHFYFNNESQWPVALHMKEWLKGVRNFEKMSAANPNSLMMVRLEDLTENTEQEMKRVSDFLNIDYRPELTKKYKEVAKALIYPWEIWKQDVVLEISPKRAHRAERYMSDTDKVRLILMGSRELKRYGYYNKISTPSLMMKKFVKRISLKARSIYHLLRKTPIKNIILRFKSAEGKINMVEELEHFYGKHRSGWTFALSNLQCLHNSRGVKFDAFIERSFAWKVDEEKPHLKSWIGFIHVPPEIPEWFQSYQANDTIFRSKAWQKSIPHCKGLFTLSRYHKKDLEKKLDIPIDNLYFPTEMPEVKWNWQKFEVNKDKKVVQIGWWLRKIHAIFQLPVRKYKKVFLKINYFNWDNLILKERELLLKEGNFHDNMYDTAETLNFLPNDAYDQLLSENIVFLNLYASSANNTVIECIVRNTPILVNPLEPVVEYLGADYPLYYNSLEEAAEKAENKDLILKAHQYLVNSPIKKKLTGDYFLESFKNSQIYRDL